MANKEDKKKNTKVRAASDKETIILDNHHETERKINSEEIANLRDQRLSLELLVEHVISNAIRRQKEAQINELTVTITFDLLQKSITVLDDSIGMSVEDFSSLVLETRFGTMIEDQKAKYDEELSLLELAAYFGNRLDLLSVSKNLTKWVAIDFNDVLNLEQVDMIRNKDEKNKKVVKRIIPGTGVRYVISNIASEFETGRAAYPTSPSRFHKLRKHLRNVFEEEMESMDLIINLNFRSRLQQKKKGLFGRRN